MENLKFFLAHLNAGLIIDPRGIPGGDRVASV